MWRVSLRPATSADAGAVEAWLGEALSAVAGRTGAEETQTLSGLQQSLRGSQELRLIALDSGEPVGLVVTSALGRQRRAIEALAISAGARNLGCGAEAIYRLEAAQPATAFLAGVPVENGLAIYFWLRIGYAPVYPMPRDPALKAGCIWMARHNDLRPA